MKLVAKTRTWCNQDHVRDVRPAVSIIRSLTGGSWAGYHARPDSAAGDRISLGRHVSLTLQDIEDAAKAIAESVVRTPCTRSYTLSQITGTEVVLKFENHQFTGSFKDRGALNKLLSLSPEERRHGVVTMSAGNHAQSVAYHAQRLGLPATIVMPRFTPNVKVEHTREFGATVILRGADLEEAGDFSQNMAVEQGLCFIHPYDDERVIAGQGTVALEMLAEYPDLDALLIPVGGGGLISGCALAAKARRPDIRIFGVEAARFPSMHQALHSRPIECGGMTIAEGIAVKRPGHRTLPLIRELVEDILLVDEHLVEASVLLLLEVEKTMVEGAGAVGLAALLKEPPFLKDRKVGLVLSGGNIDPVVLSSIIQRGLVRSGRLVQLRAELPDRPGALADITKVLGDVDANIVEVTHHRSFTNLPLKSAEVEFVLQTRGLRHLQEIERALAAAKFTFLFPDRPTGRAPEP